MEAKELHEARTNLEFLDYLDVREKEVMESKSISGLYELLDSLLVLDIDEERVHNVYQEILKVSFDTIEDRLKDEKKLSLDNDDIFFIRSFYEHAVEKWSVSNFKGAKELFFILTKICEDELLVEALNVHLIACAKESEMDTFYDKFVSSEQNYTEDKYGYFIIDFKFDKKEYLNKNIDLLQNEFDELNHLLN
tara:strand:+ start:2849 stop:3427 length:579 start_codon:yes stop_codon:yes gene_type:complete